MIFYPWWKETEIGTGALTGKMLLVRTVENDKIDVYFRACWVK